MDRFTDKLRSIKNENDLYKISISEPINDLIMYLSFVSRAINIKSAKIIFLYDHLKSLVKRKLIIMRNPRLFEIEPEIFISEMYINFFDSMNIFHFPEFICIPWEEKEQKSLFADKLERIQTIGGGTCLLHAILLGLSPLLQRFPYITSYEFNLSYGKNIDYYKRNDKKHFQRYSREYIGNHYRQLLYSLDIFKPVEKELLFYNSKGKKNFILTDLNLNPGLEPTFYTVDFLEINIAQTLLEYLRYNLIVIDSDSEIIYNSEKNKNEFEKYIIIFGSHSHFELVKKKGTNKTIYSYEELLDIFNHLIFTEQYRFDFNYQNENRFF